MYVESLVIEVGRKCNMHCEHCLRGEAEKKTVSLETAKNLISEFENIDTITFSGGEPFLYADEIIEIIDYIIETQKDVHSFYIATNGLLAPMNLLMKLLEFYGYCKNCSGDDEFYGGLDISTDQFHDEIPEINKRIFSALRFAGFKKEIPEYAILNEGRAIESGYGRNNRKLSDTFYSDDDFETVSTVYLNAEGYLIPDCDYSYESQRKMKPFKYGEKPLIDIFKKYNQEVLV